MKVSLDWLNEYVEIDRGVAEIADILSDRGFPTEGIEYPDGDSVIDIEVGSNRCDCLCHIGVARELAAALGKELKLPAIKPAKGDKSVSDFTEVTIESPELCHRYTARVISGVKVGPGPEWMAKRLEAVGIRSVNNVVDATNYAMLETGQPPHAFDYDKLAGGKIIVRKASAGETLISIDETQCKLDEQMLIISDAEKPVAIAGVMGGLETEISDTTTTILLEDAHFDPVSIRTTGRRLAIASEASFRFERCVDKEKIDWASQRTAQLITQVAGGQVAGGVVDVYPNTWKKRKVSMRLSRMNKLLGIEISKDDTMRILDRLSFAPKVDGDKIICDIASWRSDVSREVDLIEEVARSYGYDKIPAEEKINIEVVGVDKRERLGARLRAYLNGCGFYETINVTFIDNEIAALFSPTGGKEHLNVRDESRKSAPTLRAELISSLLGVLKSNHNAGNPRCRVFELANTFLKQEDNSKSDLPNERTKIGIVCDGDLRQMRGVVDGLLGRVDRSAEVDLRPAELTWSSAAAEIIFDSQPIGVVGVISEKIADRFELSETTVCAAQLDFDTLLARQSDIPMVKSLPRFPAITRDLSLIIAEDVSWADIVAAVNSKGVSQLEAVEFTAIYRGKPIPAGAKSVTISLRFRSKEETLTHEQADGFESMILAELKSKLGAELRAV